MSKNIGTIILLGIELVFTVFLVYLYALPPAGGLGGVGEAIGILFLNVIWSIYGASVFSYLIVKAIQNKPFLSFQFILMFSALFVALMLGFFFGGSALRVFLQDSLNK